MIKGYGEKKTWLSNLTYKMWNDKTQETGIIHYLCVCNKRLNEEVLQHTLCLSHL